jgi:HK97 family phage portal protein
MRQGFLSLVGHSLRNLAPVPYASHGQRYGGIGAGLFGQPAGMEAQMRAQGANGTLYAIVDRIITSYSQVEWHLYRKAASGRKEDRKEVTRHAALDLMNAANPFMLGEAFREASQQHEELTGEKWTLLVKHPASTMPLEMWPVRPDRMRPVADPQKFCVGYEYVGPSGEVVPLGLDEVIFERRPNPLDPYRGLGPVQTILTDLDSSRFSREWNRTFFMNSAEPGGILQVTKRLSDTEFREARDRWAEQHKGITGAHRVAVIENGITWVDRKYTNRDMQFVELAQQSRETIREAFGFPKPALGATDDVNRANADAAEVFLARWLVVPRLQRTKSVWNHRILPMFPGSGNLEFDYDNPVPDDVEAEAALLTARSAAAASLVPLGYDAADVLQTVGLPPMRFKAPAVPAPAGPDADPAADPSFDDLMAGLVARAGKEA